MRLVLAVSALLVILIDPAQPDRLVGPTYTVLGLYVIYSAGLYTLARRRILPGEGIRKWAHWIDVGWYAVLVALSSGTSSIFFFGFFFAILVASFAWGFASGFCVTLASVVLFTAIGLATAPPGGAAFELNRFLLRPIYLFVLGYMIAYWGGFEITLRRRLGLLREVTRFANPRFGIDHTIGWLLERLRNFYRADVCLLVTCNETNPGAGQYYLRRSDGHGHERGLEAVPIPEDLAHLLLALPENAVAVYRSPVYREPWLRWPATYHAVHAATGARLSEGQAACAAIASTFAADALATAPMQYHDTTIGRLLLLGGRRAFVDSDAEFLPQVINSVTPVLENIRLVDRLATDAAAEERARIARDLHDSIIQPYIGLQMGLTALRMKAAANTLTLADLDQLSDLTKEGIADLRGYIRGLKEGSARSDNLLPGVRRFAQKFAQATGIDVRVTTIGEVRLNDRFAAEVFQMITEGLSNIRRHTQAKRVVISLARRNANLVLRIEDTGPGGLAPAPFVPRSITEGAVALGGRVRVAPGAQGGSTVIVEIPL